MVEPNAPAPTPVDSAARALFSRAVTALQAGRHDEAEAVFARVVERLPAHANSWRNLGLIRHARGETRDGWRCLRRALLLDPAIAETPGLPLSRVCADAHRTAQHAGLTANVDAIARDWLRWCPNDSAALGAAVMAALAAGALDQTAALLANRPTEGDRDPTLNHGRALLALARGQATTARRAARAALCAAPGYAAAWTTLGTVATRHQDGEDAEPAFRRALHLDPANTGAVMGLAALRLSEGDADAAAALVLRVPPTLRRSPALIGDVLSILHHAPGITTDRIAAEHAGVEPRAGAWTPAATPQDPAPAPLRVVYVGDLGRPQVAALALPAIEAHARPNASARIAAHLVHATPADHAPTPPPSGIVGVPVHTVPTASPQALLETIRTLSPHVLVLLTPTTLPQALEALAERPAPVQVLWGDVFGGLGLPALDALLTDAAHVADPTLLPERPVCLPHGAYFFQPPPDAPDPGPPPMRTRGHLTFGSFNRMDKINDPLLARWGRVLAACPGARLVVQARALDRAAVRAALRARMTRAGLDIDRVSLEGGRDRAGMMALYATVDVALDSDPWSGGLTVLELLWMGVPTITLAGRYPNGRHAVSHLTRAGLADWIATTPEDYVTRAIMMDRQRDALTDIRAHLRDRLRGLPLCDPAAYAAQLEDAFRALWADHAAGRPPGSGGAGQT
ncbi:tetratricopeptide repeat protein [Roseospira marina]|uniref:protein O-GlcNAc transferase n=1 Tax=Roseospira marina TaxID=140057 RepID=A0A5M6IHG1_9PROT|nr:glycosyltransferase family 41 protein [Roseospira marina]KAA5607602.1 tetratricopeptide repeat protein [Roseospira marina]MBB4312203.1 Tfp pilus assembly protein PilF [Roseospira marina]MBB5085781.1 Tfp pilus assembly protein PilF [Roseospira marina]